MNCNIYDFLRKLPRQDLEDFLRQNYPTQLTDEIRDILHKETDKLYPRKMYSFIEHLICKDSTPLIFKLEDIYLLTENEQGYYSLSQVIEIDNIAQKDEFVGDLFRRNAMCLQLGLALLRNHPRSLEKAIRWYHADRLCTGRSWAHSQLKNAEQFNFDTHSSTQFECGIFRKLPYNIKALRSECIALSGDKEGLPHKQIILYKEGLLKSELNYEADIGEISSKTIRPPITYSFIINAEKQTLDVSGKGGRDLLRDIAKEFVNSFIKDPDKTIISLCLPYGLAPELFADENKARACELPKNGPITGFTVEELSFTDSGKDKSSKLTLNTKTDENNRFETYRELSRKTTNGRGRLQSVSLRFQLNDGTLKNKTKSVSIKLSLPNNTTIKSQSTSDQLIIENWLRNIARNGGKY